MCVLNFPHPFYIPPTSLVILRVKCIPVIAIQFITTLAVIQTYIREGIIILLKLVIFAMDQKNIKTNNLNYQLDQQD